MTEMTTYLKKTFITELEDLDWMDAATKERAIKKANAIEYKCGYPEQLFNDTWMKQNWGFVSWTLQTFLKEEPFQRPTTRTESLLTFTIRIKLARTTEELTRFKQPVDRSFWYQSPAQVDAFYSPSSNEMIFPAGIMQFPFLSTGIPNYVSYAMVGAVVGHELVHGVSQEIK